MKKKFKNVFFSFGVIAIVVMLCAFDIPFSYICQRVLEEKWIVLAVILSWLPQYVLNAFSWRAIIRSGGTSLTLPFWRVLKYTISGYALNYITPMGLLGGEPYRILSLTPYIGVTRATSSVILYAMMHIFSHFLFWLFSAVLYILFYSAQISWGVGLLLTGSFMFCGLGLYVFVRGYSKGFVFGTFSFLKRFPFLRVKVQSFMDRHKSKLLLIDSQIKDLHALKKKAFYLSLSYEFVARVVGCVEIWLIFMIFIPHPSFVYCIIIQAFTSLFANLFFFVPMELGTREGGLVLAVGGLSLGAAFGVIAGLFTRLRELVWIIIGIALIKFAEDTRHVTERTDKGNSI